MTEKNNKFHVGISCSEETKQEIKTEAKKQRRSVTQYLLWLHERYMKGVS